MANEMKLIKELYNHLEQHLVPETVKQGKDGLCRVMSLVNREAEISEYPNSRNHRSEESVPVTTNGQHILQVSSSSIERLSASWGLDTAKNSYVKAGKGKAADENQVRRRSNVFSERKARDHGVQLCPKMLVQVAREQFPSTELVYILACALTLLAPKDRVPSDLSWESVSKAVAFQGGRFFVKAIRTFKAEKLPKFKVLAVAPVLSASFKSADTSSHDSANAKVTAALLRWIKRCLKSCDKYKIWIQSSSSLQDGTTRLTTTASQKMNSEMLELKAEVLKTVSRYQNVRIKWKFFAVKGKPGSLCVKATEPVTKRKASVLLSAAEIKKALSAGKILHRSCLPADSPWICRKLTPFLHVHNIRRASEPLKLRLEPALQNPLSPHFARTNKLCAMVKYMAFRLWSISVFKVSHDTYLVKALERTAVYKPPLFLSVDEGDVIRALNKKKKDFSALNRWEVADFIVSHLDVRKLRHEDCTEEIYWTSNSVEQKPALQAHPNDSSQFRTSLSNLGKCAKKNKGEPTTRTIASKSNDSPLSRAESLQHEDLRTSVQESSDESKPSQRSLSIPDDGPEESIETLSQSVYSDEASIQTRSPRRNPSLDSSDEIEVEHASDEELEEVASDVSLTSVEEIQWSTS